MLPSKRFIKIALILLVVTAGIFAVKKYTQHRDIQSAIISVQKNIPFFSLEEPEGGFISLLDEPNNSSRNQNQTTSQDRLIPSGSDEMEKAPVIDHLSSTLFGNTDTITIYGEHFTESNTVILSIEFKDKFSGIVSPDGKTITFTANLSLSQKVLEGIDYLDPETKKMVLEKMISVASKDSSYKDGWYVPATIAVKTAGGLSNVIPVNVNVTKGI